MEIVTQTANPEEPQAEEVLDSPAPAPEIQISDGLQEEPTSTYYKGEFLEELHDEPTEFDGDSLINRVSTPDEDAAYNQMVNELGYVGRLESPGAQLNFVGDALNLIFKPIERFDNRNLAEVSKALAYAGLTQQGIRAEDLPDEVTPDQLLHDVLGVEQEIIDLAPFTFDPNKSVVESVQDWVAGALKLEESLHSNAMQDLAKGALSVSGLALMMSGHAVSWVKRLKNIFTGANKTNTTLDREQYAQELFDIKTQREELAEALKNRDGSLAQRVEANKQHDLEAHEAMRNMMGLANNVENDVTVAILNLKAQEFYGKNIIPIVEKYNKSTDLAEKDQLFDEYKRAWIELGRKAVAPEAAISAGAALTKSAQGIENLTTASLMRNLDNVVTKKGISRDVMMHQIGLLPNVAEQISLMKKLSVPGAWKRYNEFLISGALSGSSTYMGTNPLSNASNVLLWLAKVQVAGLFIPGKSIQAMDASIAIKAMLLNFRTELSLFKKNLGNPKVRFGKRFQQIDVEAYDPSIITSPTKGASATKWMNYLLHQTHRMPINMAVAQDEFFKGEMLEAWLQIQAYHKAKELPGWKAMSWKERRVTRDQIYNKWRAHPEKFDDIYQRGYREAAYVTNTSPLGPIGEGLIDLANSHPGFRTAVWFLRTPFNVNKMIFKESPGIGQAYDLFAGKFWSKDPYTRQLALGKAAIGTGVFASMWDWNEKGILNGVGASEPSVRENDALLGRLPQTIAIDRDQDGVADTFVQFAKGTPIGNALALTTQLQRIIGYLSENEKQKAIGAVFFALQDMLDNTPLLEHTVTLADFVKRAAQITTNGVDGLHEWMKDNGATYLLPFLFQARKQLVRALDNRKQHIDDDFNLPDAWTWEAVKGSAADDAWILLQMLGRDIPGVDVNQVPELDMWDDFDDYGNMGFRPTDLDNNNWGKTIQLFMPFTSGTKNRQGPKSEKAAIVTRWARANGVRFEPPPKSINGVSLNLKQRMAINILGYHGHIPKNRQKWGIEAAKDAFIGTATLDDILLKQIYTTSDRKEAIPNSKYFRSTKAARVVSAYNKRHTLALDKLLQTPLFDNVRFELKINEAKQKLKTSEERPGDLNPQGFHFFPLAKPQK